jgi:hypothetical protein
LTAKDYLLLIPALRNRIALQCRLVDDYLDEACRGTSGRNAVNYGGTDRHSRVETYMDRIIDRERKEIDPLRMQLHQIEQAVIRVIDAMPPGVWGQVIEMRYLKGMQWGKIQHSLKLGNKEYLNRLHGDALAAFAWCSIYVDMGVIIT